jgi:hypothetical protein
VTSNDDFTYYWRNPAQPKITDDSQRHCFVTGLVPSRRPWCSWYQPGFSLWNGFMVSSKRMVIRNSATTHRERENSRSKQKWRPSKGDPLHIFHGHRGVPLRYDTTRKFPSARSTRHDERPCTVLHTYREASGGGRKRNIRNRIIQGWSRHTDRWVEV